MMRGRRMGKREDILAAAPTFTGLPQGCDVASYQGNPNWDAVKASGIAFAFSKVTEDTGYTNPTFRRNWSEMKRVGIIRGAYHFARPEVNDAKGEADYFLDQIDAAGGLQTGDMLALDLEAGAGDLGPWTLAFLRHCEARAGFKPLIYTGTWFSGPHNLAAYPDLGQYGLWLAAYQSTMPAAPPPWTTVAFWQYSDKGQVPGINGDVDLNVFNGDLSRMAFYGKPGAVIPPLVAFSVGEGIRAMMTKAGDAPSTDELFFKQGDKDEWSEAYGTSGSRYVYVTSLNRVFRYTPAA